MSELVFGDFVLKLAVTIEIIIAGNTPCVDDVIKKDDQGRVQAVVELGILDFFHHHILSIRLSIISTPAHRLIQLGSVIQQIT